MQNNRCDARLSETLDLQPAAQGSQITWQYEKNLKSRRPSRDFEQSTARALKIMLRQGFKAKQPDFFSKQPPEFKPETTEYLTYCRLVRPLPCVSLYTPVLVCFNFNKSSFRTASNVPSASTEINEIFPSSFLTAV